MESGGKIKVSGRFGGGYGERERERERGDLIRKCVCAIRGKERDGSKSGVAEGGCQLMELRTMRIC